MNPDPSTHRGAVCGQCAFWHMLDLPPEAAEPIDLRIGRPGQCRRFPMTPMLIGMGPQGPQVAMAWPGPTSQHEACGEIAVINRV